MVESELFWCIVGDRVQTHFLYKTVLSKEEFQNIKLRVNIKLKDDKK